MSRARWRAVHVAVPAVDAIHAGRVDRLVVRADRQRGREPGGRPVEMAGGHEQRRADGGLERADDPPGREARAAAVGAPEDAVAGADDLDRHVGAALRCGTQDEVDAGDSAAAQRVARRADRRGPAAGHDAGPPIKREPHAARRAGQRTHREVAGLDQPVARSAVVNRVRGALESDRPSVPAHRGRGGVGERPPRSRSLSAHSPATRRPPAAPPLSDTRDTSSPHCPRSPRL